MTSAKISSIPFRSLLISVGLAGIIGLSGCSALTVKKEEVERESLGLSSPDPVKLRKVEWYVITPENSEEVFERLSREDRDLVLFGLTDNGYENLSKNLLEIRNYMVQQGFIILKYKEYYEPTPEPTESEEED